MTQSLFSKDHTSSMLRIDCLGAGCGGRDAKVKTMRLTNQGRHADSLNHACSRESREKWLHCGYMIKVESTGLPNGLDMR